MTTSVSRLIDTFPLHSVNTTILDLMHLKQQNDSWITN